MVRMVGVVLAGLCVVSCSKNSIPLNAHVQDLGGLEFRANTPKQLPVSGDVSLYCVSGRPEQLPQKVELLCTVTRSPDNLLHLGLEVVPTPGDYKRLWLKQLSVPVRSGDLCEVRVGENEWIRFTATVPGA